MYVVQYPGVVDESPETAQALARAAAAALAALNLTGEAEVALAAVEPGEPLALPARLCQQVSFHSHAIFILLHFFESSILTFWYGVQQTKRFINSLRLVAVI